MTAPEKIVAYTQLKPYRNINMVAPYNGWEENYCPFMPKNATEYVRIDLYEAAQARIKELEQLDSEAATHVESQIAMFERFTGEPPYVGWKGLGLALKEELEAKDERIKALEAALNEAADYIDFLQGIINKSNMANDSEYMLHPDCPQIYRAIAGGKDETKPK